MRLRVASKRLGTSGFAAGGNPQSRIQMLQGPSHPAGSRQFAEDTEPSMNPEPPPEASREITDSQENSNFVPPPQFNMLPQNRHSLYARCRRVMTDIVQLLGLRYLALLATSFATRAKTITPRDREHDLALPPVAPPATVAEQKAASEMETRHSRVLWLNPAALKIAAGLKRQARKVIGSFRWPSIRWPSVRWPRVAPSAFVSWLVHRAANLHKPGQPRASAALTSFAAALTQRAKRLGWPNRQRHFAGLSATLRRRIHDLKGRAAERMTALTSMASSFVRTAHRKKDWPGKGLAWRNWIHQFASAAAHSGFAKRGRSPNRFQLRPFTAPAALIALVLTFALQIAYKRPHPAGPVQSAVSPAATALAQPLTPKPHSVNPGPAPEAVSASTKLVAPAVTTALPKLHSADNRGGYSGNDVTVRTFTGRTTQPGREPKRRIAHFGDDVTVRYFETSPTPPARTATR